MKITLVKYFIESQKTIIVDTEIKEGTTYHQLS